MTVESIDAPDIDRLEAELLDLIGSHLVEPGTVVDATCSLGALGMDSMATMQLLVLIERRFGVWLPESELAPGNLASVRRLAAVLGRELAERTPGS